MLQSRRTAPAMSKITCLSRIDLERKCKDHPLSCVLSMDVTYFFLIHVKSEMFSRPHILKIYLVREIRPFMGARHCIAFFDVFFFFLGCAYNLIYRLFWTALPLCLRNLSDLAQQTKLKCILTRLVKENKVVLMSRACRLALDLDFVSRQYFKHKSKGYTRYQKGRKT